MKEHKKYLRFRISHPVDIEIACNYVDNNFKDRVGARPSADWSWLGKTSEQLIHYRDRSYGCIVFDTENCTWVLRGNLTRQYKVKFSKDFKCSESDCTTNNITWYHGPITAIPFNVLYDNDAMDTAKRECTLPSSTLSLLKRVADLELAEHLNQVSKYNKKQQELRAEQEAYWRNNYGF